jgi:hypothetical protein
MKFALATSIHDTLNSGEDEGQTKESRQEQLRSLGKTKLGRGQRAPAC